MVRVVAVGVDRVSRAARRIAGKERLIGTSTSSSTVKSDIVWRLFVGDVVAGARVVATTDSTRAAAATTTTSSSTAAATTFGVRMRFASAIGGHEDVVAAAAGAHDHEEEEAAADAHYRVDGAELEGVDGALGLLRGAEREEDTRAIAIVVLLHDEELVVLVGVGGRDVGHLLVLAALVDVDAAAELEVAVVVERHLVDGEKGGRAALVEAGRAAELSERLVVDRGELNGAALGRIGRGAQLDVNVALGGAGERARYALVEAEVGLRGGRDAVAGGALERLERRALEHLEAGARARRDQLVVGDVRIGGGDGALDGERAVDAGAVGALGVSAHGQVVDGESGVLDDVRAQVDRVGELGGQVAHRRLAAHALAVHGARRIHVERVRVDGHGADGVESAPIETRQAQLGGVDVGADARDRIGLGHLALDRERLRFVHLHLLLVVELDRVAAEVQQHVLQLDFFVFVFHLKVR